MKKANGLQPLLTVDPNSLEALKLVNENERLKGEIYSLKCIAVEGVKPTIDIWKRSHCGKCNSTIYHYHKYCCECGGRILW